MNNWCWARNPVLLPSKLCSINELPKTLLTFKKLHAVGGRGKEVMEGRAGRQGKTPERKSLRQKLLSSHFLKVPFIRS